MKKISIVLLLVMLIPLLSSVNLNADSTKMFANFGIVTDDSLTFDSYLWYIGANIDFSINDLFMVSPELNVMSYKFEFSTFLLEPAVLANLKFGTFFAGAGLTKLFVISGNDFKDESDFALKLNAGFRGDHIRFRVFLITPFNDLFGSNLVGAQIGLGF
jgi:hypothetical protein